MILICVIAIIISTIVLLLIYRNEKKRQNKRIKNLYDFDEIVIELIELVVGTICYIVIVASSLCLLWQFIF